MDHRDLVHAIARRTGIRVKDVDQVLRALTMEIDGSLTRGERTYIAGLGVFYLGATKTRLVRDVSTGKLRVIPSKYVPRFRFSSNLV